MGVVGLRKAGLARTASLAGYLVATWLLLSLYVSLRRTPAPATVPPPSPTRSLAEAPVTPVLSDSVLFFNRVPKCGSEMFVLLLQWLSGANGFKHVRLPGGTERRLTRQKQLEVVDAVTKHMREAAVPLSFDRHVYFINFTSHGTQSPTYFNVVRDPIQKALSRFYYKRITANLKNPDLKFAPKKINSADLLTKDFNECYAKGESECRFKDGEFYDLTIPYFCGHIKWCMTLNDEWALMEAKARVEKYYPVVGVLEDLNATLSVLEHKLPYFFSGVTSIYYKQLLEPHKNKNKLHKKGLLNESIEEELKKQFRVEYEFYYWIRQRLLGQYKQIMLLPKTEKRSYNF